MNRKMILIVVATVFLVGAFIHNAAAFYQWVDKEGNLHVSDNPPPGPQPEQEPALPGEPPRSPGTSRETRNPIPPATTPQTTKPLSVQPQPPPTTPTTLSSPTAAFTGKELRPVPLQSLPQVTSSPAYSAPPAPAPAMPAANEAPRANVPSPFVPGNLPRADVLTALFTGFLTVFLFIAAGAYIYTALCLYLIAKKLNVAEAWAAWIPIIQIWPFLSSAGKPCWWVILLFIPFVNAVVGVYLWMCIAENLGRNKWLGLLMLLPIINFVLMGVLAFAKEEAAAPAHAA